MNEDCPCNGCTAETGRGPGCHTQNCPRGWYEWGQTHQQERAVYNGAARVKDAVDGILIDSKRKACKKRRWRK